MTDALGWWSFDGGLVKVTTPFYVQAEAYGGLEQRGGLPLSTSRFERKASGAAATAASASAPISRASPTTPRIIYAEPAPAFGVALETSGAELRPRRALATGASTTPGSAHHHAVPRAGVRRLPHHRRHAHLAGAAGLRGRRQQADLGGVKGGFSYDLYNQIVASYYARARGVPRQARHARRRHRLLRADLRRRLDLELVHPQPDHDAHRPRRRRRFTKRFAVSAIGGVRIWTADGDPEHVRRRAQRTAPASAQPRRSPIEDRHGRLLAPTSNVRRRSAYSRDTPNRTLTTTADVLGNLSGRYRFGSGDVGLRGMSRPARAASARAAISTARSGSTAGATRSARACRSTAGPTSSGPIATPTSFGYVLAAGFNPASFARLRASSGSTT